MLKNYFKIAIAVLKRNRFFTFISLFGISCTLAVLMVITAFVDHLTGTDYPEFNAERSLYVMNLEYSSSKNYNRMHTQPSFDYLNKYVRTLKTPEKVTISSMPAVASSFLKDKKYDFKLMDTDGEFWDVMHFRFLEGKPYTFQQIKNFDRVAVISDNTRKTYFGEGTAVGKYIMANNIEYRVVGVIQGVAKTKIMSSADIYVPYTSPKSGYDSKSFQGSYHAILVAKSSSDFKAIEREYQNVVNKIQINEGNWDKLSSHADTYIESFTRSALGNNNNSGATLVYVIICLLLFLFLLLPTVNLVNINISRIFERSSEIGVRKAFGASSGTLVLQFIFENIILTIIGGCIGLIITIGVLLYINSSGIIPDIDLKINLTVLKYGFILCLIFGLLSGVYPAFKMSKLLIIKTLKSAS